MSQTNVTKYFRIVSVQEVTMLTLVTKIILKLVQEAPMLTLVVLAAKY